MLPYSRKCEIPNLSPYQVSGVNKDKEFFEPSHQVGADTSKYQVVPPCHFACNLMHVGRDRVLPIAYNHSKSEKYVSPAYTVFSLIKNGGVLDDYLFIMLKCEEQDRYFWFHADASVRDGMSWSDFCDVEITVPDLPTQQKYVDIYKAMVANQQSYERGLEDLKLTCDACIDMLSDCYRTVGDFVEKNQKKNQDRKFTEAEVKGFNNDGQFIKPMRLFSGDVARCTILQKNDFVYNLRVNSTIERLSIAINESCDIIVSPDYESFYVVKDDELYPYYLYMLLQRESFAKKVLYVSFGSSTTYFRFNNLCEIKIPVPEYSKQVDIATIYRTYKKRWMINEQLKAHIKDICPILIRGSLSEPIE